MSLWLILTALGLMAISGLPGALLARASPAGQWTAAVLNVCASILGGVGAFAQLLGFDEPQAIHASWALPNGRFAVGVDALSALFLLPMLLVSALGSIFGLAYWKQSEHLRTGGRLRLSWGILTAGMMLVVLARDSIVFLMAWEIMALAGFFLVATEDAKPEVRRAAFVYLVATHVGTLCLFAFFGLLRFASGTFDIWPATLGEAPSWLAGALFITGVIGFGLKAGLMPLHVWLPGAHANAPSHVSALLSGVLLKAGIYGIVRVAGLLPDPPSWWGATLLIAGSASGILGIAYAVAQHDFKRLLAYSSIENMGIIAMGIGLAMLGRTAGHPEWVVLGLTGSLLHVLNHSLFKPLLFFAAGSILHAAHTREIDSLGGLAKTMPRTFAAFVVGAIAICGLPPLNGFASEILIYAGLLRTAAGGGGSEQWVWAALAAVALAAIGALAVGCFVKLLGAVFAGAPRSPRAEHARDPGAAMLAPLACLALFCAVIGVAPAAAAGVVASAVAAWDPAAHAASDSLEALLPLSAIAAIEALLLGACLAAGLAIYRWRRIRSWIRVPTWDCGYLRTSARMQYSGSSFGQALTLLFGWALLPRRRVIAFEGPFPRPASFASEIPDAVLDRGLLPLCARGARLMARARKLQRGPVQVYLVYVLGALLALLLFSEW
ncbi:MAG: hypothetical protein L0Z55_04410 [Planctomycetes bacterium]|nr:hypothetical protein [Planctomycetota bacterium]